VPRPTIEAGVKYRRILLITDLAADSRGALAAIRSVAPGAERLVVLARLPERKLGWFADEAPPDMGGAANAALDALRAEAAGAAATVEVRLAPDADIEALDELAASAGIDLLVAGSFSFAASSLLTGISIIAELRKRRSRPVLWVPDLAVSAQSGSGAPPRAAKELVCVAIGRRASVAVAAFLRDQGEPAQHVTVLLSGAARPHDLATTLDVAGVRTSVELVTSDDLSPRQWLAERIRARPFDLLVFPRLGSALLLGAASTTPCLVLPPPAPIGRPLTERALDAADVVDLGGPLRARFEYAVGIGRRTPIPDQALAFVSRGRVAVAAESRDGEVQWSDDGWVQAYGVFRIEGSDASRPLAAVELHVAVLRPGSAPLVLFDAELVDEALSALAGFAATSARTRVELLAVRLRPLQSCRSIRARLQAAGLPLRVVDASTVLDEGAALDVPELADAVRLARTAARMRAAGFPVSAIVHSATQTPSTIGFAALHVDEIAALRGASLPAVALPAKPVSLAERLDLVTGAPVIAGNRIEIELDNVQARRWLLAAIGQSVERIHFQIYMAADDDIGRRVEAALVQAAARGVTVRLLVDSLHGLHGSLGVSNPLLERLGACPGIELRVAKPISGVPALEGLKQRDHRKLVIVDNRLALVGGRNVSHEYYTGFDEVALGVRSMWRQVPWLDAGARVEGPAVTSLEHGFLEAWHEAGGSAWPVADCGPAGSTAARVVTHRGLRDAYTLDAYLAMIETAQSHVYVVNGFPLILEIQHALLRALRRGVRVRVLTGNLTPTHGEGPFEGPWSSARVAATEFVHSRVDALVAAGAEGYQFSVAQQPAWEPGLGPVRSHVHAKLMSADGRVCAVGSANMDITAGYWESELLLVAEDASIAAAVESRLDALIAESKRIDREDPQWRQQARRRAWMRHWPGVLSV